MKIKWTIFFLILAQFVNAQENYYQGEVENTELFSEKNLLPIFLGLIFMAVVIGVISNIEAQKKAKSLHRNIIQDGLTNYAIMSFFGLVSIVTIMHTYKAQDGAIIFVSNIIQIFMAFFTSAKAEKLGRNKTLWLILGYIQFPTALMILSKQPALIDVNTENNSAVEELNNDYKSKENNLHQLQKANLLDQNELKTKLTQLSENYQDKLEVLMLKDLENNAILKNNDIIAKLHKAHEDGLFTSAEFEKKLKELQSNNS